MELMRITGPDGSRYVGIPEAEMDTISINLKSSVACIAAVLEKLCLLDVPIQPAAAPQPARARRQPPAPATRTRHPPLAPATSPRKGRGVTSAPRCTKTGLTARLVSIITEAGRPQTLAQLVAALEKDPATKKIPGLAKKVGVLAATTRWLARVAPGTYDIKDRPQVSEADLTPQDRLTIKADPKDLTDEGRARRLEILKRLGRQ